MKTEKEILIDKILENDSGPVDKTDTNWQAILKRLSVESLKEILEMSEQE